jgi:hypothetical protein
VTKNEQKVQALYDAHQALLRRHEDLQDRHDELLGLSEMMNDRLDLMLENQLTLSKAFNFLASWLARKGLL